MLEMCIASLLASMCATIATATQTEATLTHPLFDAAPFAMGVDDDDATTYTIKWSEPRKIRKVVVQFDAPPTTKEFALDYWHHSWSGKPDPVHPERNAGSIGWDARDDWFNGEWRPASTQVVRGNNTLTFTFDPSNKLFPKIDNPDDTVTYIKTLKLRLRSNAPLPKLTLQAITDSQLQPLNVRIQWEHDAPTATIEVYNGQLITHSTNNNSIKADVLMAVDPVDPRYDATVVTVRSKANPFSFSATDVARGERIYIKDFGVLVTQADDPITLAEYRERLKEYPGKTVYDRVFDEREQTLPKAWDNMPVKRPLYFVHGLPGNRNLVRQDINGDIVFNTDRRWMTLPVSDKDTQRQQWTGHLNIRFGLPTTNGYSGRELAEGYLPQVRTWFQDGPVFYEQTTLLDALDGELDTITLDDPTVVMVRLRLVNTSDTEDAVATLRFGSSADGSERVKVDGNTIVAVDGDTRHIRMMIDRNDKGLLTSKGEYVEYSIELSRNSHHTLYVAVPSITINTDEASQLSKRTWESASSRVCDYWRNLTAAGTQVHTSEPWLDDFYRSHARHLMVNCYKEIDSDRLHAHVGSFRYGVYPNESAMMVSDLDRRGYHDLARRNLDAFLHYQGSVGMPGTFTSPEGQFYGAGGHETGGYNKSHGYVLWLMAEHWWMTRDRDWMAAAAPKLIEGCEFVIRERQTTMRTNADGSKVLEYGFLPAGSLEDVTDFWYWEATNSATVWGFLDLADALKDFGHPRADEMQREAKAYYDDFMAAINESTIRCPVVKLRDATYVPKVPSRLYERGRAHGWLRETLEGSMFLPAYKLIPTESSLSKWILQDYEDNLYISDDYGYSIPAYDLFWFHRGGFSMQANLLDGPLPYLYRDEIKHYVRAVFNGFASAFYPEIRMCNEHSLPELGYPAGDHFKSSDESQVTYWLRLMFVSEDGDDLYLGKAIPRYWLGTTPDSGQAIGIDRAASAFGPLGYRMTMNNNGSRVTVTLDPPTRNAPKNIYLRIRHPEKKRLTHVSVNGTGYDNFDADKEWIVLPGTLTGQQTIEADYK